MILDPDQVGKTERKEWNYLEVQQQYELDEGFERLQAVDMAIGVPVSVQIQGAKEKRVPGKKIKVPPRMQMFIIMPSPSWYSGSVGYYKDHAGLLENVRIHYSDLSEVTEACSPVHGRRYSYFPVKSTFQGILWENAHAMLRIPWSEKNLTQFYHSIDHKTLMTWFQSNGMGVEMLTLVQSLVRLLDLHKVVPERYLPVVKILQGLEAIKQGGINHEWVQKIMVTISCEENLSIRPGNVLYQELLGLSNEIFMKYYLAVTPFWSRYDTDETRSMRLIVLLGKWLYEKTYGEEDNLDDILVEQEKVWGKLRKFLYSKELQYLEELKPLSFRAKQPNLTARRILENITREDVLLFLSGYYAPGIYNLFVFYSEIIDYIPTRPDIMKLRTVLERTIDDLKRYRDRWIKNKPQEWRMGMP